MNNDLFTTIKEIALSAVESSKPCDWRYGYIKDTDPLTVSLSEKLEIDSDFIEFGNISPNTLELGDKLILLQKKGGQLFLVLDVIKQKN